MRAVLALHEIESPKLAELLACEATRVPTLRTVHDAVTRLNAIQGKDWDALSNLYGAQYQNPGMNAARRVLCEIVARRGWAAAFPKGPKARERAVRNVADRLRPSRCRIRWERPNRKTDAETRARWKKLLDYLEPIFSNRLKDEAQAKGAYDNRRRARMIAVLRGILGSEHVQAACREKWGGPIPAPKTILAWLQDRCPRDARLDVKEQARRTVGNHPGFAGQTIEFDATGDKKMYVPESAADFSEGKSKGRAKRWQFFMLDRASGQMRGWWQPCTSENNGWPQALPHFVFSLEHAPENIVADRTQGLFEPLYQMRPGDELRLNVGAFALLAMGSNILIQAPGNPQAKGRVEGGVNIYKNVTLAEVRANEITEREIAGNRSLKGVLTFDGEDQYQDFMSSALDEQNARKGFRGTAFSRNDLWNLPESAAWRASRKLVDDSYSAASQLYSRAKVVRLIGGGTLQTDGGTIVGEIKGKLDKPEHDFTALVIPGSLCASDQGRAVGYCYAVDPYVKGTPHIVAHRYEIVTKDAFGIPSNVPPVGQYKARPLDDAQRKRARRDMAAAGYRKAVGAEHQTGNDEEGEGFISAWDSRFDDLVKE